jgi:hypothetical protein
MALGIDSASKVRLPFNRLYGVTAQKTELFATVVLFEEVK